MSFQGRYKQRNDCRLDTKIIIISLKPPRSITSKSVLERKGNVLFNDALNTFYLRLYGVGHMVKDHSGYSLRLTARVLLYAQSHRHTTAFITPVVEHWLEREIAQWVHPTKDRSDDPSRHLAPNLF